MTVAEHSIILTTMCKKNQPDMIVKNRGTAVNILITVKTNKYVNKHWNNNTMTGCISTDPRHMYRRNVKRILTKHLSKKEI